jgi:predicted AAA+ superfamily ATPase
MDYIRRAVEARLRASLRRGRSVLLLGARQTGKTTLIGRLGATRSISLVNPEARQRYERDPSLLTREVEALANRRRRPLVTIDEIQKVPALVDAVQDLVDRRLAKFVLTGSSARKLRRGTGVNLLPGRVATLRLDPLVLAERAPESLDEAMFFGSLPGILASRSTTARERDLRDYVTTYLEEEVRAEAIVRRLGAFGRFLELAASQSGDIVNYRKLSQEIGVAHTTIQAYYEILEDCLIAERIEPFTESRTRHKLTRSSRYVFFDLGVRRAAAREGTALTLETRGRLFEQYVGLELLRRSRLAAKTTRLRFWRDPDGPEVDWIVESEKRLVPVEVKWTERPTPRDARNLFTFLREYDAAKRGYVVCRSPSRVALGSRVLAIPWQELGSVA